MTAMEILRQWTRYTMFYLLVTSHFLFSPTYGVMDFVFIQTHTGTFYQAERYCSENGFAGLAVLDTRTKMNEVKNSGEFKRRKSYWVGLQQTNRRNPRQDTYAWRTGTTWAEWKRGEPNYLRTDHCARLWGQTRNIANKPCSETYNFICEKSPPTTTTTNAPQTTPIPFRIQSAFYPIIHKDQTLQDGFKPQLVLFSGPSRSEIDCAVICTGQPFCAFLLFAKSTTTCTTYSSALGDESFNLTSKTGSNVRRRIAE